MKSSIIIGFILGFGIILVIILTKEDVGYFFNPSALAITLGGTIAALIIYFSPHALKEAIKSFFNIFSEKQYSPPRIVDLVVDVNKSIRKTSYRNILNFDQVRSVPFLVKGLSLIVDGVSSNNLEEIMIRDSRSMYEGNRIAERVFGIAGSFAPMFGMMGTVIGLIAMLHRIDNPAAIPAAMGLALVTTLYGLILSALVFKPISGKIRDKNMTDSRVRDIIIEGVLSIQRGENSQITKERLIGFLN